MVITSEQRVKRKSISIRYNNKDEILLKGLTKDWQSSEKKGATNDLTKLLTYQRKRAFQFDPWHISGFIEENCWPVFI